MGRRGRKIPLESDFLPRVASNAAERLLLLACSGTSESESEVVALYSTLADETAWNIAREHELEGVLAHKLLGAGGSKSERWQTAHKQDEHIIGSYLAEVDRLAELLLARGIPLVALKNAGIARGIYRCAGCSPMGDVDLLVRRTDYVVVHEFLLKEGYTCNSRNPHESGTIREGKLTGGTEYQKDLPGVGTFWLELQWRPVSGRWLRPDQEPKGDELMARAVSVPGTAVKILAPQDNLLQVCLHTAKHSYVRAPGLRLHTDVERIVRGQEIEWDAFVNQVFSLRVRTAVYFSLWLPAKLLGTPVPERVLESLSPSPSKKRALLAILLRAGLFYPSRRKFSSMSYIRFNSLLYDSSLDLLRAVFPDREWMKSRYDFESPFLLPYYHVRRIVDLSARRVGI